MTAPKSPKPEPAPDPLDSLSEEALDWLIAFFLRVLDRIEKQPAQTTPERKVAA